MPKAKGATVPLTELLAELMATAAANPGTPAGKKLTGGLHVAALQRPTHLTLTTWRTVSKPPSATECEVLARDAGLLLPIVKPFTRPGDVPAFAIVDRAASPDQCDHDLSSPMHGDGRSESFWTWRCTHCEIRVTHTRARRGNRSVYEYGDQEVTEKAYKVLTVRGPKPWKELQQREVDLISDMLQQTLIQRRTPWQAQTKPEPVRPAPRPVAQLSTPVDTEAQKVRDEAERQRHIQVLTFCALTRALRSPWFRRPDALSARLAYLKGATVAELREERQGRYARVQLVIGQRLATLLSRWPLTFRALPVRSSLPVARKPRKPRQPRQAVAA